MAMFAVGNGLSGLSPNFEAMLVFRFLSGLPHGAYFGVAALVAFRALDGPPVGGSTLVLQRGVGDGDLALVALYLFGLSNVFIAALSLVV